jgi:hypothetical protein
MSVSRTTIVRSPGKITFGGATFYPETSIDIPFAPDFDDILAWAHGKIDYTKKDLKIPVRAKLWGGINNLSVLFPAAVLTPVPGTSLCSDAALVVLGKNGDQVTFHNAFISKLIDLELGIDKNFFAAEVEFMCLIKSGKNPTEAGAYYTRATGVSFTDSFDPTTFLRQRWTAAWAGKTGLTSFEFRAAPRVNWNLDVQYDYSPNYGTDNAYLGAGGLIGELTGIPAVADVATLASNSLVNDGTAAAPTAFGTRAGASAADLTLTGATANSIVLKNAFMVSHAEAFDITKTRAQETKWRTTTGFSAGTPAAIATIS